MAALAHDTAVHRAPGAYAEPVGDATLVLDATGDRYVRLNRTGGWLFARLTADPVTVDGLAPQFADAFDVPYEQAVEDVQAFLGDMVRRGLALPV
jgi:hypothetical protein